MSHLHEENLRTEEVHPTKRMSLSRIFQGVIVIKYVDREVKDDLSKGNHQRGAVQRKRMSLEFP